MFVTEKEARERLDSEENLLRRRREVLEPAGIERPSSDDPSSSTSRPTNPPRDSDPSSSESEPLGLIGLEGPLGFSTLDELNRLISIGPKKRAAYKMNRPAQSAIAEVAHVVDRRTASEMFGLSQRQTGAYAEGMDGNHPDKIKEIPEVKKRIKETKERLSFLASQRLGSVLQHITEDRIAGVDSVQDLARVGRDIASIMDKMEPKEHTEAAGVHFHIYRPEEALVDKYDSVEIGSVIDVSAEKAPPQGTEST